MAHGQGGAEIAEDRSPTLTCNHEAPIAAYQNVTHHLRGEGFDASEDGTGRGTPLVPVAFVQNSRDEVRLMGGDGGIVGSLAAETGAKQQCYIAAPVAFPANLSGTQCASAEDIAPSMGAKNPTAVAFDILGTPASEVAKQTEVHTPLRARTPGQFENSTVTMAVTAMQVRRLTPIECERLQGFPDGYTAIPWRKKPADQCPDGPRYKALGNSWAVPNVRWIGRRIDAHLRMLGVANDNQPAAAEVAA